jgi:hypothetical protein
MVTTRSGRSRWPATTRALERGDAVDAGLAGGVDALQEASRRRGTEVARDTCRRRSGPPSGGEAGLLRAAGRGSFGWRGEDPSGGCEENPQRPRPRSSVGGARGPSDGGAGNPSGGGSGILRAAESRSQGGGTVDALAGRAAARCKPCRRCRGVGPGFLGMCG